MGFCKNLLTAIGSLLFFESVFVEEEEEETAITFFLQRRAGGREGGGGGGEGSDSSIQGREGGTPAQTNCEARRRHVNS